MLAKCLSIPMNSLFEQSYKNLEIILVDDGSTDLSGKICDEYANIDDRIKVIHQTNVGLSAARNAGMSIATGEYLYFVDSDDYIDKNLCMRCIDVFDKSDVDIVFT